VASTLVIPNPRGSQSAPNASNEDLKGICMCALSYRVSSRMAWKCVGESDKSHRQVIIGIPLASGIPNLLDGPACVFPHNIGVLLAYFT
jgi:hypothetical protein